MTDFAASLVAALEAPQPNPGLADLLSSDGGRAALPEVWALKTLSDDPLGDLHKENFTHTLKVVAQCGPEADLVVRLAALLHDIGKPSTRSLVGGKVSFHYHETRGAMLAERRLGILGIDRAVADAVCRVILAAARAQSYDPDWSDAAVRRVHRDAGANWDDALRLARADVTSKHQWKRDRVQYTVDQLEERLAEVLEADRRRAERAVLSGHDLGELGVVPGPEMGRLLAWLLDENRAGRLTDPDEARAAVRRRLPS